MPSKERSTMNNNPFLFVISLLFVFSVKVPLVWGENDAEKVLSEINSLKQTVAAHETRIKTLEHKLHTKVSTKPQSGHTVKTEAKPISGSAPPWHNPAAWKKIRNGMSARQVTSILGKPTSKGMTGILFYRGNVGSSGFVSGNVKVNDDRVWAINKPVF